MDFLGFFDERFCFLVIIFGFSMRLRGNGVVLFEDFMIEFLGLIVESFEV